MIRYKIREIIENINKFEISKRQTHTIFAYQNLEIDFYYTGCCISVDDNQCEITKEEEKFLIKNLSELEKTNKDDLLNLINFNNKE